MSLSYTINGGRTGMPTQPHWSYECVIHLCLGGRASCLHAVLYHSIALHRGFGWFRLDAGWKGADAGSATILITLILQVNPLPAESATTQRCPDYTMYGPTPLPRAHPCRVLQASKMGPRSTSAAPVERRTGRRDSSSKQYARYIW